MTHPHPNRRFVPQTVLTTSGKINTDGANVNTVVRPVNTAVRPVNIAGSKPTVNHPRPISNAYKKVKDTTARDRVVGNPQQKEYKEKGVIDSGFSRHMTKNKFYLTEYEDYDGGFVSFGDVKGRISGKDIIYLKGQPKLGLWYPRDSPFNLETFSDSDYAGASLDEESIIGGCQLLGKRLISWQCKKQTIFANSTTEAEYVAVENCCGQVLWIQNQMLEYGFNFMNTQIFIDNESTICIVKNPVFRSKAKHIEIRHHFIKDCYEKKLIQVIKIHTNHNVAYLLTKAFDVSSGPINLVADETVYKEWEDIVERAATTASSLDA
ncbi:hypothetical protein Tco_0599258 [Tanacetum coccineum]